jgi:tetratricopeptide (TPR) repeat protein
MEASSRFKPGDTLGGLFQVHQVKLGGMGEVYLCVRVTDSAPLALKTFQRRYLADLKIRGLFKREAATWMALEDHPNVVRCAGLEVLEDQPFLILEWVAGHDPRGADLRGWLRHGALGLRQSLDFAIDLCRALDHAQRKRPGLVHRDLKPENVLIAGPNRAKVTDFGLALVQAEAAAAHPAARRAGVWQSGTPAYMAPEQWKGERADLRTDLYAVGCILFEMLSGHPLFGGATRKEIARRHFGPAPWFPESCPEPLRTILQGCLAGNPADRFSGPAELLEELAALYREEFAAEPHPLPSARELTAFDHAMRAEAYHLLNRHEEAIGDADRAIALDPALASTYVTRGLANYRLGRLAEALGDYTRSIELDPTIAATFTNRGNIHSTVGRHDLALADFSRAIELAPGAKEPRANRALTYAELGRYEEALADINTAIEHNPEAAWVYQARAGVLASQGHEPEALADFDRALELEPMLATALVGRAMLYIDLEQLPEACNDLRRAIEINPGDPEPYVLIASVFFSLDDYREVRRYFNMLAQRADPSAMRRFADEATKRRSRPKDASAWNFEGMLLSSLGEHQEAIAAFEQAHAAAPEVADLLVNLGFALARAGRSDEALQHYDRALELNANSESAWHNKGSWLRDHGRYREAIECFDQDPAVLLGRSGWELDVERSVAEAQPVAVGQRCGPADRPPVQESAGPALEIFDAPPAAIEEDPGVHPRNAGVSRERKVVRVAPRNHRRGIRQTADHDLVVVGLVGFRRPLAMSNQQPDGWHRKRPGIWSSRQGSPLTILPLSAPTSVGGPSPVFRNRAFTGVIAFKVSLGSRPSKGRSATALPSAFAPSGCKIQGRPDRGRLPARSGLVRWQGEAD